MTYNHQRDTSEVSRGPQRQIRLPRRARDASRAHGRHPIIKSTANSLISDINNDGSTSDHQHRGRRRGSGKGWGRRRGSIWAPRCVFFSFFSSFLLLIMNFYRTTSPRQRVHDNTHTGCHLTTQPHHHTSLTGCHVTSQPPRPTPSQPPSPAATSPEQSAIAGLETRALGST
jgi:hypothetical protein